MNGIIIINKPKGYTSHDIVSKVKRIYNEKVGHTGTLDPMATGVLPLLIGKGTLCSKYLMKHDKTYNVKLELGKKTDTADAEGNVIEECEVDKKILNKEIIIDTLKSFLGKQEQIPPMYSAIKVKGKKLYEYARKGIQVEIQPRKIEIYDIELISVEDKQISFTVSCSKGTYIRSLCEDIASKLGTIGYMTELERQRVGDFDLTQSITIEELEKLGTNLKGDFYISIENLFKNSEKIELQEKQYTLFLNGGRIIQKDRQDGIYKIYLKNQFVGIGVIKESKLKRDIII